MNMKMLSESQKRIANQEIFRRIVLDEVKTRVSRRDYKIIVENYDLLLHDNNAKMQILSEGVGDFFNDLWGKTKAAFSKLGEKFAPEDNEKAKELENKIKDLLNRSAQLRKEYEEDMKEAKGGTDGEGKDSHVTFDQETQIKIAEKKKEAGQLGAQAIKLTQEINAIRKKYDLPPVKFELDDEGQTKGVLAPDDGKYTGPSAAPDAPDAQKKDVPPGDPKVPDQVKKVEDDFENKKAPGIFRSIIDSYKYAFGANASMWKSIYNGFNKAAAAPAPSQDDILLKLLVMVMAQADKKGTPVPADIEQQKAQAEEEINDAPDEEPGEGEEEGEGAKAEAVPIRKGKDSLQSRLSKLFPDLARKKGTFYYNSGGKIVSKNTSALAAIINDIISQLEGSDIAINESLFQNVTETMFLLTQTNLLTEVKLSSWKSKMRQVLQNVRDSEEDPKKRRKKIDKFLYRLRHYAEKGDMDTFSSRYKDIKGANSIASGFKTLKKDEKETAVQYSKDYAQKQFMSDDDKTVRGKSKGEAPTMSKDDMKKSVPVVKKGFVNISQIIGPKLKAAGYDLTSPEGADIQKRLLKVIRRFLDKALKGMGKEKEVKVLAQFSKSKPKKKKEETPAPKSEPTGDAPKASKGGKEAGEPMNESLFSARKRYINFYSHIMLEEIRNELSN